MLFFEGPILHFVKTAINHYLGPFLCDELTVQQLSFENGCSSIEKVELNVSKLNEILEEQKLPLEVVEGYVDRIRFCVPLKSIFQDSVSIDIRGLEISIKPINRSAMPAEGGSMMDSMYNSLLTSMSHVKEDCLRAAEKEQRPAVGQSGLHSLASAIDSIIARIRLTVSDVNIRFENSSPSLGIALELRAKRIEYFDDMASEPAAAPASGGHPDDPAPSGLLGYFTPAVVSSPSRPPRPPPAPVSSFKNLQLFGLTLHLEEFIISRPTSPQRDDRFEPCLSEPASLFRTVAESPESFGLTLGPPELEGGGGGAGGPGGPVQVAQLGGTQALRFRVRQPAERAEGPAVELKASLGACHLLLAPGQVHALVKLAQSYCDCLAAASSGQGASGRSQLHQRGPWGAFAENQPMTASDFARCDLCPSPCEQDIVSSELFQSAIGDLAVLGPDIEVASVSETVVSDITSAMGRHFDTSTSIGPSEPCASPRKRGVHGPPNTDAVSVSLSTGLLTLILLHEEPRPNPADQALDPGLTGHSKLAQTARGFFSKLGARFLSSEESLESIRTRLAHLCTQDHLSLVLKTASVSYSSKVSPDRPDPPQLSCRCSVREAELLEVLFERKNARQSTLLLPNDDAPTFVELLVFSPQPGEEAPCLSLSWASRPDSCSPGRRSDPRLVRPGSDLRFSLAPFSSELDPSLVDRINDLLQPHPRFELLQSHRTGWATGFDRSEEEETELMAVHVTAQLACVHVRFPVPDLQPASCRVPWWRRNLRKDFLRLELTSFAANTTLGGASHANAQYELTCTQLLGFYCEPDREPLLVLRATDSQGRDVDLLDLGEGIDWPRVVITVSPVATSQLLGGDPLDGTAAHLYGPGQDTTETLGDSLERELLSTTSSPGSSPFSRKNSFVSENNREQIRPGSNEEMAEFRRRALRNSRLAIHVELPRVSLDLHGPGILTALYHRLACDLALWTPAAPSLSSAGPAAGPASLAQAWESLAPQFLSSIHCVPMGDLRSRDELSDDDEDSDKFSSCANTLAGPGRARGPRGGGQTELCVRLEVGVLQLSTGLPIKLSDGSVAAEHAGQAHLDVRKASLFYASAFEADPALSFLCLQLWSTGLDHTGRLEPELSPPQRTIAQTECHLLGAAFPHLALSSAGGQEEPMLALALRVRDPSLVTSSVGVGVGQQHPAQKIMTLALGLNGATLHHRMTPVGEDWISQLMLLFDLPDPPICGFQNPPTLTTTHVSLDRCLVEYRPLQLPCRALLACEELYLATNAVLETDTTMISLNAQELSLFLSNRQTAECDLSDFVCVLEMGVLRLELTYSEAKLSKQPKFDLVLSNNVAHLRTCADSSSLLIQLVEHLVNFGDLPREAAADAAAAAVRTSAMAAEGSRLSGDAEKADLERVDVKEEEEEEEEEAEGGPELAEINSQLEDALREDPPAPAPQGSSSSSEEDFVMVDLPKDCRELPAAQARREELEELSRQGAVISCEAGASLRFKNDHFDPNVSLAESDPLADPGGFPCPLERYTVREVCLVWHLYGGSDFNTAGSARALAAAGCTAPSLSDSPRPARAFEDSSSVSIASEGSVRFSKARSLRPPGQPPALPAPSESGGRRERGGPGRQLDTCMELSITKLRYRHCIYGEQEVQALRQVLIVQEIEVRDRLASSNVNQFLYLYSSPARPHFANEPMLRISLQHVRPELPAQRTQECILRIAVQPLRLNIDQDAVIFLRDYATLSGYYLQHGVSDRRSLSNSSGSSRRSSLSLPSPSGQSPVMQAGAPADSSRQPAGAVRFDEMREGGRARSRSERSTEESDAQPVYFREVIVQPAIFIKLDYYGKRLDFGQGTLTAVVACLAQLNDAELELKALHCRTGLLGWPKVAEFLLTEWSADITNRQLPRIFSGVGPMHSFVQLGAGLRDLVWMPVQRYRADGRILHGLQLGARSFSSQTVDALLTLAVQFVSVVHKAAETSYDLMNPGPSLRTRYPRLRRPADIREGVTNAAVALRRGVSAAASDMATAARGDEDKGLAGAVGGVLRQVAPTALVPLVVTSEAVHNVIGGVRNQLRPDTRREEERKYKS